MPYKITLATGETREVPRVTEVIRAGMPRPKLTEWELREVVNWVLDHHYPRATPPSTQTIIAAWRRDHARHANRGTAVHKWVAAILKAEPPPALMASQSGYKRAFTSWMVEHLSGADLRGAFVEQTLTDSTVRVAGTCDFVHDGHLYDWKTVEKRGGGWDFYPDQLAQLGAYASMTQLVGADLHVAASFRPVRQASIVRLYADGTHETKTVAGDYLLQAITLWYAVRRVARANMEQPW